MRFVTITFIYVLLGLSEMGHAILNICQVARCQLSNIGERADAIHISSKVVDVGKSHAVGCPTNA